MNAASPRFGWTLDREALSVERKVREMWIENEAPDDLVDFHRRRKHAAATAAAVNGLDRELAPLSAWIEVGIRKLDVVDIRRRVVVHRQVELGEEGFLVVVNAMGLDEIDVHVKRLDLTQRAVARAAELHRRELQAAETARQDDDEGRSRSGARRGIEGPVFEGTLENTATHRKCRRRLGDGLRSQRFQSGAAGRPAQSAGNERHHIRVARANRNRTHVGCIEWITRTADFVPRLALATRPAGRAGVFCPFKDPWIGRRLNDQFAQAAVVDFGKVVPGELVERVRIRRRQRLRERVDAPIDEERRRHPGSRECSDDVGRGPAADRQIDDVRRAARQVGHGGGEGGGIGLAVDDADTLIGCETVVAEDVPEAFPHGVAHDGIRGAEKRRPAEPEGTRKGRHDRHPLLVLRGPRREDVRMAGENAAHRDIR